VHDDLRADHSSMAEAEAFAEAANVRTKCFRFTSGGYGHGASRVPVSAARLVVETALTSCPDCGWKAFTPTFFGLQVRALKLGEQFLKCPRLLAGKHRVIFDRRKVGVNAFQPQSGQL